MPSRLVSCHRCAVHRFDLLFEVLNGISQVSQLPVCVHLDLNKCVKPYLHLSFSKVAWTLCWTCELVGLRVVYSRAYGSSQGTLEYDVSNSID